MNLEQLLKEEENQIEYIFSEMRSKHYPDDLQDLINGYHYTLGRKSFIEDLIKKEYGYREHEFRIRQKKGTLFENKKG